MVIRVAVLHLIRKNGDRLAVDTALADAERGVVAVVLLQDGLHIDIPLKDGLTIYALGENVRREEPAADYIPIDYERVVELIAEHPKVVCW